MLGHRITRPSGLHLFRVVTLNSHVFGLRGRTHPVLSTELAAGLGTEMVSGTVVGALSLVGEAGLRAADMMVALRYRVQCLPQLALLCELPLEQEARRNSRLKRTLPKAFRASTKAVV